MKKSLIMTVAAAVAVMSVPAPAQAKKPTSKTKHAAYTHRSYKSQQFDANDAKCIEAEALDPGGAYKAYPCWARAALAPKSSGNGWQ